MINDTPISLQASSKALHWSAIMNLAVASDIVGAGSSGEFNSFGVPPEQIYGAAIGVPGVKAHSGYGMFTDGNGNTICIADEGRPEWGMIWNKELLGKNPYVFKLQRNIGSGGAFEANAFMVAGIAQRFGEYAGWMEAETSEIDKIPGLTLQRYNDFPGLLRQIEGTGRKFDRPIAVLLHGKAITLETILENALNFILSVARPFAGLIGIPPELFDLLSQSLQTIATSGHFSIATLAQAAQLIVPAQYRSLIPSAQSVYSKIASGNYLNAIQELGVTSNIPGVAKALLSGDVSTIVTKSSLPYSDLVGKVQTMFHFDTIRSLAAANRSGSVITNLIDSGTMTKVPVLQNLLTTTTADTLTAAVPGVSEIMQTAINQTNDIAHPDLHKGAVQLAVGQIVGSDTFDDLTLRGLQEQANAQLEKGAKQFIMPITIPETKRNDWAQIIADSVQMQVIADSVNNNQTRLVAQPAEFTREWA